MGNNDVFAVIADKTRRGILTVLKDGERPVGDLVAELGVSQPTVSKHLKILREAGMVSMEAQGQRRLYAVRPEPLAEVTHWIHEVTGDAVQQRAAPEPTAPEPAAPAPTAPAPGGTPGAHTAAADEPVTGAPEELVVTAPALREPGPELLMSEPPGSDPSAAGRPAGGTPRRPARGAGARAADLLAGLPGLRRRPRHPRR
ncbi:ArsR/SmtB family transcription factor [Kocuria turfanensis]|nr:metalloregulator ArsR/SmtB family transcription factor [Kocuria turfanensis]